MNRNAKKIVSLPKVKNASDMFKCNSCGYALYKRVLGDTCTCPQCGATMRRL